MAFLTCSIERIIIDNYRFYNYTFSGKKKVAVEEPAALEVKPVEPEPAPLAPAPGKYSSITILLSEVVLYEIK